MKREEISNIPQKECYFYAPLTDNLEYTSWDGSTGLAYHNATYSYISGGCLDCGATRSSYQSNCVTFNTAVPMVDALTMSFWYKHKSMSTLGRLFSWIDLGYAKYSCCGFGYDSGYSDFRIIPEYLNISTGAAFVKDTNAFRFITLTVRKNENVYSGTVYVDGEPINSFSFSNGSWKWITANSRFSIGFSNAGNNTTGYYKHCSCYAELTDEEVKRLYQNGGTRL